MKTEDLKDQTIICGTLQYEDLYPCFRGLLFLLDPEKAQGYREWHDLAAECLRFEETWALADDLDNLAPEGYYFGGHPGDGADFGFWKLEEE